LIIKGLDYQNQLSNFPVLFIMKTLKGLIIKPKMIIKPNNPIINLKTRMLEGSRASSVIIKSGRDDAWMTPTFRFELGVEISAPGTELALVVSYKLNSNKKCK
jgi:hypothetical protein